MTNAEKTVALLEQVLANQDQARATITITETVIVSADALGWTRERLWAVPADTMLSTHEASQALDKSVSAIHKLCERGRLKSSRAKSGHLVRQPRMFRAGDLRLFLGG
jgi:hypothetical protein